MRGKLKARGGGGVILFWVLPFRALANIGSHDPMASPTEAAVVRGKRTQTCPTRGQIRITVVPIHRAHAILAAETLSRIGCLTWKSNRLCTPKLVHPPARCSQVKWKLAMFVGRHGNS
ncbi:hypothetical protein B0T26DRAFT_97105 [Lasiosphaeria miniovina]|uniref:Secreted protein n=1 Tax=Lasiosphaeria miniovina TaxID=1954250 RepID=A0AA40EB82_9PEZI|nr:uncharacterized protein B0T26DRAFT_97105 [Lasiosphaeria miniovina]KAK0735154.1 hypothetical protein B0T26DRAFT_97105 [Lasiosphaeria miniovina]